MDVKPPLAALFVLGLFSLAFGPAATAATLQETIQGASPVILPPQPLYDGAIPNSKPTPDAEVHTRTPMGASYSQVSRPTYTVYLPGPLKATGAAVLLFPGGGYRSLSFEMEGTVPARYLNEHGIAAIIVKYRLPSPATMIDPTIGPLQDAQRALQIVREHAAEWRVDPHKVGVMGFSAGGHLAGTVISQFDHPVIPNPRGISLRPDFAVLVYPVVTMTDPFAHAGSRTALLGPHPAPELVRRFSVEEQVSSATPPTLILAATDDQLVPVENSLSLYEALHRRHVPAALHLFARGDHGFFLLTRDEWQAEIWNWLKTIGMIP